MKDVFWWFLRSTFMAKSKKEQEKKVHWEERIKSKWKHKDQTDVEYFTRQDGSEAVAKSWSEIWVNSNKNNKQTNKQIKEDSNYSSCFCFTLILHFELRTAGCFSKVLHQFTTAESSDLQVYWGVKKKKWGRNSLRVLRLFTFLYKL